MDYREAIRIFLAENGEPVTSSGYFYIEDDAAQNHVRNDWPECGWLPPAIEEEIVEKRDTVYLDTDDLGHSRHWIEGTSPGCRCGKFTDVLLRWDGSVTDALAGLLGVRRES